MYGIFTFMYHKNQPNVGKYTIQGSYGYDTTQLHILHSTYPNDPQILDIYILKKSNSFWVFLRVTFWMAIPNSPTPAPCLQSRRDEPSPMGVFGTST